MLWAGLSPLNLASHVYRKLYSVHYMVYILCESYLVGSEKFTTAIVMVLCCVNYFTEQPTCKAL